LTPLPERQYLVSLINEATANGARKAEACRIISLSIRTLQRWVKNGLVCGDERASAVRPTPSNKLSTEERKKIVDLCNEPEFASLTPNQIVPTLADRGIYHASEASFYRILKDHDLLAKRVRSRPKGHHKKPRAQTATAPNQVWTWDISYLPSHVKGQHYYLYMILDIFSRKIVGAEVYSQELGAHGADLLQRSAWAEKCVNRRLILHSDNGAPMRSFTMLAKMQDLGVISSYSRPRVSNDNPYSESLFKTVKYCPQWPLKGFLNSDDAREWVDGFVHWYNTRHKHSGIKYVTPEERHGGLDLAILSKRDETYQKAKLKNPGRWSRRCRNWDFISEVKLNPEKDAA
tara:strand:+ start:35522 stop:36559 length:1038 start_codon:yes stop_codon:yes gene_type:complete